MKKSIYVPFYNEDNWKKLKQTSLDSIPGTYESYLSELENGLKKFNKRNKPIIRVEIKLDEMITFLSSNNLTNISDNRNLYINTMLNNQKRR